MNNKLNIVEIFMKINSTYTTGIYKTGQNQKNNRTQKTSFEIQEPKNTGNESTFRKIASKYNIRSITTEETASLSQELYNAGEISLLDHAILSFDPDRNLPYGTGFLTQADSTGHRDLIAEYEAQISMDKKMGDKQSLESDQRVFEYLKLLDAAKGSPFYAKV